MTDLLRFKQEFDDKDLSKLGAPWYFDVDHYLDSVEQMISADEIIFALKMLDNMPGYYRDFPPKRALDIKTKILQQTMDIADYVNDSSELEAIKKPTIKEKIFEYFTYPRAETVTKLIHNINKQGLKPTIIEYGPADYWLPIGLKESCNLDFYYAPITINKKAHEVAKEHYPNIDFVDVKTVNDISKSPQLYLCFEVIEHLHCPEIIAEPLLKYNLDPDIVMISCPLYTMGGGLHNWSTRELGHIRTFTPKELLNFADSNFTGRSWTHMRAFSQVVTGIKASNPT